jgi:hypothetical protein
VFLLSYFLVLTLNTMTLPILESASRARTGTTTEGGIQPLARSLCGQMDPDYKALFDKVVKAKAYLPGPKARDSTRKVKVTFTMTMHLIKLCIENPSSMDEMKETHRGDGAAYWEWLKDQPVSRAVVGEDGDVTRIRHLFPVTKHGRKEHELNIPRGTVGGWLKKYTHLVNQAPAPPTVKTPTRGSAIPVDKTPCSELRRRIADLQGELQRQDVKHRKEIADLTETHGGFRDKLGRRDPDRDEERDDSELKKAREESAKWKRKREESVTRLQRAEEERNEAEHKAYNLEVDVEEKGAETAKLQKSQGRLLKDLKSKEEETEAQKSGSTRSSRVRPPRSWRRSRRRGTKPCPQPSNCRRSCSRTYHCTYAKPRQNEFATPKRTVDELEKEPLCGLGQYGANKRQKAASPLPEVDLSDAPLT